MRTIILLTLAVLTNSVYSQKLIIEKLEINKSKIITVKCSLQNGNDTLVYYKYQTEDICNSIMSIKIIRYPSKWYDFYRPCTGYFQLDNLYYTPETTIRLLPGEKFQLRFTVDARKYPFKKSVKRYGIIVHLWNKELPNLKRGMFDRNLSSNEFKFVLK